MRFEKPEQARQKIREYYREADLWLPENPNWRFYKLTVIDDDGTTSFKLIKDRVTSKKKLREHLVREAPLNVYFSVSCWLNPTKTRAKTYKKKGDGRYHADKNGFLFSDIVIDFDHRDTEEVMKVWNYLVQDKGFSEENMDLVFSGGGWHINIWKFYRNRDIAHPIEREKDAMKVFQAFAEELIDEGFEFDYLRQGNEGNESINSPTADTRRVRKLPGTITKYGNVSQLVSKSEVHNYTEEQVVDFETKDVEEPNTLSDELKEVEALCRNK